MNVDASTRSADAVPVRPDLKSKSSTGSMIAACPLAWSATR